jgi:hypothetical protein
MGGFEDISDRVLRRMSGPKYEEVTENGSTTRLEIIWG